MGNACGASYRAAAAADAVEAFVGALFKVASLGVGNVLHDVESLRTGLRAGVAADAAVDFGVKLHHHALIRLDFVDIVGSLVRGEERNACHVHALLYLCLAGKAGLQFVLALYSVDGRGANGEDWKLERDLNALLKDVEKILDKKHYFFILNTYSLGFSAFILENLVTDIFKKHSCEKEFGELYLEDDFKKKLPLGVIARFTNLKKIEK